VNGSHIKVRSAWATGRVLSQAIDDLCILSQPLKDDKIHIRLHPVRAHSLPDLRYLQAMQSCSYVNRARAVSSHREIFCQESLAEVVVKICHLSAYQVKLLKLECMVPYLNHKLVVVCRET